MIIVVNKRLYTEPDLFYIGRGSPLGNPYTFKPSKFKWAIRVPNAEIAVAKYKEYIAAKIKQRDPEVVKEFKELLRVYKKYGRVALGCYCKHEVYPSVDLFDGEEHQYYDPTPCHGDVIRDYLERLILKYNA